MLTAIGTFFYIADNDLGIVVLLGYVLLVLAGIGLLSAKLEFKKLFRRAAKQCELRVVALKWSCR